MFNRLKSERITISSNDLAGVMTRLNLSLPQIPAFAMLPIGVDEVSEQWLDGNKISSQLIAVAQAISEPKAVIHWNYVVRANSSCLESRIFSRSGKAPYVQVAPKENDLWDVTILSTNEELYSMLAGMCTLQSMSDDSFNNSAESIKLSLPSLMLLCAVADASKKQNAQSLLSMKPNRADSILTQQLDIQSMSVEFQNFLNSNDLRWSSALVSAIAGKELIDSIDESVFDAGVRELLDQDLVNQEGFLGVDSLGLINLLSQADYAVSMTVLQHRKGNPEVQMMSVLPSDNACLLMMWMGGEAPYVYLNALPPTAIKTAIVNLVD